MKCTLLGTGTSQGVPVIGCQCEVCRSTDPRDHRLRQSALIESGQTRVLIDSGPDFRQQMLRAQVQHLDAILLTHEHNDHVIGIDDVRPFNFNSGHPMSVYALPRVAHDLMQRFAYIFGEPIPGLPRIRLIEINENSAPIRIGDLDFQPIGVQHGPLPILGFRVGPLAYLTDVKYVLPTELVKIMGVKYLIVNTLQHKQHPTHMNLTESLEFVTNIGPQRAWLTHISHHLGLTAHVNPTLPPDVTLAYDGLEIDF
jgi:phosphoribosyl 1,2-cyclic phosphate phosphodiesterase